MIAKAIKSVLIILGAALFFQLPVFMQQYQHQLIGHVEELRWQLNVLEHTAKRSGKNLEHYIKKFTEHSDRDFSNHGEFMQGIKTRCSKLTTASKRLQGASLFTRPFVFLFYLDWQICRSTWGSFEPGIALSLEGLIYALIGMLFGHLIYLSFYRIKSNKVAKIQS